MGTHRKEPQSRSTELQTGFCFLTHTEKQKEKKSCQETEKAFNKTQHLLLIKVEQIRHRKNILQHDKTRDKPAVNTTLSGEGLKSFPLRSGASEGCPLAPFFSTQQ